MALSGESRGDDDLYFLEGSDVELLKQMIDRERRRTESGITEDEQPIYVASPEVLLVKLPATGIDACDFAYKVLDEEGAETGETIIKPGVAECEVWKIKPLDELDIFEQPSKLVEMKVDELAITKIWVFNVYPVKWYAPLSDIAVYVRATKDRSGRWLAEKPPYQHKVKPTEDVNPGETKDCTVVIGDGTIPEEAETIPVKLKWMDGSQPIETGTEATAIFREMERVWEFDGAECRT